MKKEERLKVYKTMLRILRKDSTFPCYGFCSLLSDALMEENHPNYHIEYFSELMEYKPEDYTKGFYGIRINKLEDFFWFRRDWLGKWKRKRILRKIIRDMGKT